MSYRKITVDGREYKYTIGRSHVKVAGVGVWTHDQVGQTIRIENETCWCGCGIPVEPYDIVGNITPADIARKIKMSV